MATYLVQILQDVNPLSDTYGDEKEEKTINETLCPDDGSGADWIAVSYECEADPYDGMNSGNAIVTYRDNNINSPTFGQTYTATEENKELCPPPDRTPAWETISHSCIEDAEGYYTGEVRLQQRDTNRYSYTYEQTRDIQTTDTELCPIGGTKKPIWQTVNEYCQIEGNACGDPSCMYGFYTTGRLYTDKIDTNPNSDTYNTYTITYVDDVQKCKDLNYDEDNLFNQIDIKSYQCAVDSDGLYTGVAEITATIKEEFIGYHNMETLKNYNWVSYVEEYDWNRQYTITEKTDTMDYQEKCPIGVNPQPQWQTTSYLCELNSENNFNGYASKTQKDVNQSSPTYNTTQTIREYDEELCPPGENNVPEWSVSSYLCTLDENGNFTGTASVSFIDINEYSPSYNETKTEVIEYLELCPIGNNPNPAWQEISHSCETDTNGYFTGTAIIIKEQTNPYCQNPAYGSQKTFNETNLLYCPMNGSTNPVWQEISHTCVVGDDGYFTGYAEILKEQVNEYCEDPAVGTQDTFTEYNETYCQLGYNYEPIWETISEVCEDDSAADYTLISQSCLLDDNGRTNGYVFNTYDDGTIETIYDLTLCPTGYLIGSAGCISSMKEYYENKTFTVAPYKDTSCTKDMELMFNGCEYLTTVPLYVTSNVTDMGYMFGQCTSLPTVPLFDTSKVTRMIAMFSYCSNLTTAPLFNTSNVTNMSYMFNRCTSITTVPLYNTSNVLYMGDMFNGCTSLTEIPQFDTSNVTDMGDMFNGCTSLTSVPQFNTSNVTTMGNMFYGCENLTTVPLFDTSKVTYITNMFYGCENLTTLGGFTGLKVDLDLSDSPLLTRQSVLNVFNEAATVSGKYIYLHTDVYALLSEEDIAIATNKGWSVVEG